MGWGRGRGGGDWWDLVDNAPFLTGDFFPMGGGGALLYINYMHFWELTLSSSFELMTFHPLQTGGFFRTSEMQF